MAQVSGLPLELGFAAALALSAWPAVFLWSGLRARDALLVSAVAALAFSLFLLG